LFYETKAGGGIAALETHCDHCAVNVKKHQVGTQSSWIVRICSGTMKVSRGNRWVSRSFANLGKGEDISYRFQTLGPS
jgi:hypothetical protein